MNTPALTDGRLTATLTGADWPGSDPVEPYQRSPDRSTRQSMMASVDAPDQVAAAEAWLSANRDVLTLAVDDGGCGCCTRYWRLEGPADVLATIPYSVSVYDPDWETE